MGPPGPWRNPCPRPCEHVSLSVLTMRCAIPNTTETNSQRSLTEDRMKTDAAHCGRLRATTPRFRLVSLSINGNGHCQGGSLGPSEPRLVVVETRRPVEKQTANQDPAPSSPVCPDGRSARDRICVMARRWQIELWKASTSAQTTNISMSRRSRGQNITISSILSAHCPVPAAIALLAQIDWASFPRPRSDRDGRGRWPSGLHGGQYDLGGAYEDAADTAQLIYSHHSGPATTSG